jgi:alkyl hydroperoxide reductase subunit AhpF
VNTERQVIIIGSGPAGLTAALYAARANLKPLVIEGIEAGGQLMLTTMVENWPGYRDGIMGPDLMQELRAQAERFGAEIIQGDVSSVDLSKRPFTINVDKTRYLRRRLIVATGASRSGSTSVSTRSCRAAASRPVRPATVSSSRDCRSPSSAAATPRWKRRSTWRSSPPR